MERMKFKGSIYRIRECANDLLALEEDLIEEDEETLQLIGREMSLKSSFMYCDLSWVISNAGDEHKQTLIQVGNTLFCCLEELRRAVNSRSISLAQLHYNDTALALQEVMTALKPLY